MDAIPRITDNDVRRRGELRRFFSRSGFLVGAASDGLECLAKTVALEPDVLVIALAIPRSEAVVARWNHGWLVGGKPLVLAIGDAPPATLSARTGVALGNCFTEPIRRVSLLDRIRMELAVRLLRRAEDRQRLSEGRRVRRTLMAEGVQ